MAVGEGWKLSGTPASPVFGPARCSSSPAPRWFCSQETGGLWVSMHTEVPSRPNPTGSCSLQISAYQRTLYFPVILSENNKQNMSAHTIYVEVTVYVFTFYVSVPVGIFSVYPPIKRNSNTSERPDHIQWRFHIRGAWVQ